jgi:hypothetical protein
VLFANGNVYYVKQLNQREQTRPLIFHINYLATMQQKKHALEVMDCWFIDPKGYQIC